LIVGISRSTASKASARSKSSRRFNERKSIGDKSGCGGVYLGFEKVRNYSNFKAATSISMPGC
ncbi:MAG: hypothetical protein ACLQU2_11645, partial [Candidatus Binataceae bacterium]